MRETDGLSDVQKKAILDERAAFLSQVSLALEKAEDHLDLLEVVISGERFAFEAKNVREASKMQNLTPLPCTPSFVMGLLNYRGQILPLIDIREILELPQRANSFDEFQVVVIQTSHGQTGIFVDEITGICSLAENDLQEALQLVGPSLAPLLKGISVDRLAIVDLEKLLSDTRLLVNSSGSGSVGRVQ